ncbi:uncharacterized protein [Rhodnius prolixus]|uniref:uncharacterized protein n=1 Tax=Rhodnius prolixus TaxID=13249 RepID=UPI003D18B8A2
MVIFYFFLLGLLIGVRCDEADNAVDIGETVKEVESILAEDPKLPRLTRGEIVSLIEEVRNGKDLMVVLPQQFNTTLEEMFTAKPVTQIIHDNNPPQTTKRPKRRRKPVRPVYVHTTSGETVGPTGASTEPTVKTTAFKASTTPESITEEWQPKVYVTPHPTAATSPAAAPSMPSEPAQSTPDVSVVADSLSPDMKELLSSFGLLGTPSTTAEPPTFMLKSITPSVDPTSYSRFKPLPSTSEGMSPDMKSFLASYGLLDIRKSKSLAPPPDPLEHLPYQDVLEELGLRKSKKLNHVFNPNEIKNSTEELHKVNKILMKLREYSEGNATDFSPDEVNELLLLENNTKLAVGEDPIDSFQSFRTKIEVKRQQPNDTDLATTTEAVEDVTTDMPTTSDEEDSSESTPSGTDLEDSFGRGETSTRRPNGFYFLLDWNSFLDVGLEDRQVNLNFSPKVGDPKNFIPVTIP